MTISRNLSFLAEGASSTGVLSVSYGGTGNVTLTAGYIPYGNGTGAFNSSANLYFSGTQLGVGTSSPNAVVHAYSSTTNAGRITIQGTGSTAGNYRGINLYNASGFSGGIFQDEATNALSFWNSAAPLMTLDNSGNLSVTGISYSNSFNTNAGVGSYFLLNYNSSSSSRSWKFLNDFNAYGDFAIQQSTTQTSSTYSTIMYFAPTGGVSIGNTTDAGAGNLNVNGTVKTGGYTVATLPTGVTGARTYVTNALAPTYGSTVVGGGSVTIPVFYNGTNWIVA